MKCLELERDADSLSVRARACVGGVRPDADFGVAGLGGARPEHGGGVVRHICRSVHASSDTQQYDWPQ